MSALIAKMKNKVKKCYQVIRVIFYYILLYFIIFYYILLYFIIFYYILLYFIIKYNTYYYIK